MWFTNNVLTTSTDKGETILLRLGESTYYTIWQQKLIIGFIYILPY